MKLHRTFVVAITALLTLTVTAAPAASHRGRGPGKKPVGTIASFDGTTLTVNLASGQTTTATVTDDTRVKVEHRGHHMRGPGHGNPSEGSLDDLAPGTFVLRMKVDDGVVEQIRVRPAAHETDQHGCPSGDNAEADESTGEDVGAEKTTADESGNHTDHEEDDSGPHCPD